MPQSQALQLSQCKCTLVLHTSISSILVPKRVHTASIPAITERGLSATTIPSSQSRTPAPGVSGAPNAPNIASVLYAVLETPPDVH
ncbi:hypothetical protein PAXRUDRAFT_836540 [Paxillus rubicundulus Ve08.2h10]|uniref:Uncharacterized protein n=1 Tax=Paxillus rubicundulus Ve08.2h10 TaxID=930991 RepID=A0A0D0CN32_9AGAM|nr:hypothetical protein PAXRUDRAFT_836540 [Paxillus rubicundulus Ve08.2h10]